MTEIRFYHLTRQTPIGALPEILMRALGKNHRIFVRTATEQDAESLNDILWTYQPESFLPHGLSTTAHAESQPVLVGSGLENPSNADVLILMPGATPDLNEKIVLCCQMLDGTKEDEIATSRALWKKWKAEGQNLTYWQQSETGRWEQKA